MRFTLIHILLWGILSSFLFSACDGLTDNYQKYLEGGEIIYPEKARNVTICPGKYRVEMKWTISSDPLVSSAIIYWNNKKDHIDIPFNNEELGVEQCIYIDNLNEEAYTFEIFTFDKDGNRSVASEANGTVYGDKYRTTLVNRAIDRLIITDDDNVQIVWGLAEAGAIAEEISYLNAQGEPQFRSVDVEETTTVIDSYDFTQTGIELITVFIPDTAAIDTFHAAKEIIPVERIKKEKEVRRSQFSLYALPGDYSVPNAAGAGPDRVWINDGCVTNGTYISKTGGHVLPQWFTFDMGEVYDLTQFTLYQRGSAGDKGRLYAGGNLWEFEIWGAVDPDPSHNPDDYGGDFGPSWTLLKSCSVDRPSGNKKPTSATRNDNTEEDIQVALAGHNYVFDDVKSVRYIRIKGTKTWDSADRAFINISALRFWAMQY